MTKEIIGRIAARVLLEFVPPTLVGVIWAYINRSPTTTLADSATHFSAGFVVIALMWSNLLRIQYQQTTRAQQAELAGDVQDVDTQV